MLNRFSSFLLVFAIFLFTFAISGAHGQSYPLSTIDPSGDTEFPGGRGTDMMVLFTPGYGKNRTGTNEWGMEAIVAGGIVRRAGGNDSAIPPDGFVVSGHGKAARWISENLSPGTAVTYDTKEVRLDDSASALEASAHFRLGLLSERVKALKDADVDISAERSALFQVRRLLEGEGAAAALDGLNDLKNAVWEKELQAMPSPKGEIRAVWHRMTETTPEAIARLAEEWEAAGVNVAFPETIYGSQALFIDETGFYTKLPQYGETDALAVLIKECHARGIQVHAWVHCFFIGIDGNAEEPALLAEKHPEWLLQDRRGRTVGEDEPGFVYFDPARPEVRQALIATYTALARNYAIDGFQFDYIRYPQAFTWEHDWGYSPYTRERVKKELGFDPQEITPASDPEPWAKWRLWREERITSFVREASEAVRAVRPQLVLSADVFPDLEKAIDVKGQNWSTWAKKGYIDAVIPMAYSTDTAAVLRAVEEMRVPVPSNNPLVIGLGPFLNLSSEQLIDQIQATRQSGVTGQCLFSWDTTTKETRHALGIGPWRDKTEAVWGTSP